MAPAIGQKADCSLTSGWDFFFERFFFLAMARLIISLVWASFTGVFSFVVDYIGSSREGSLFCFL